MAVTINKYHHPNEAILVKMLLQELTRQSQGQNSQPSEKIENNTLINKYRLKDNEEKFFEN